MFLVQLYLLFYFTYISGSFVIQYVVDIDIPVHTFFSTFQRNIIVNEWEKCYIRVKTKLYNITYRCARLTKNIKRRIV